MEFSSDEKALLRELRGNAVWERIVRKLRRPSVHPYKPGASHEDWIYESGQVRENEKFMSVFGVDDER